MHPLLVKRLFFPLHERWFGRPTLSRLRELERTQWLDPERLRALQLRRLRAFLEYAYDHVPYYRARFDARGIHPRAVQSFADFDAVPFLTRQDLRERFDELRSRDPQVGPTRRLSTGGSTGEPVSVLADRERLAFQQAARLRAQRWFGVDIGAREATLWGAPMDLAAQDRARLVRDALLNIILLSAFDFGREGLERCLGQLARHRPEKLFGYASAIYLLASYLRGRGAVAPFRPRAVFTTAEPLYEFQRRLIRQVFECPVAVEYGARDVGIIANECRGGGLHVNAEGLLVEIIGAAPTSAGEVGEIVVTNFDTPAMPIIRYRTGDVGALMPDPCPCGRGLPRLRSVEGRQTDFLVTPQGRLMHALAVIYVLRDQPGIDMFQVVQETLDRLSVRVVANPPLPPSGVDEVRARLRRLMGAEVSVDIFQVPTIERTPSGKHRHVISRVARAFTDAVVQRANGAAPQPARHPAS